MIKGIKGSGVKIEARSFKFDGDKLKYKLNYRGNGKAPDKRFDTNCEGLCIFIWPSETIVFYAYKWVEMYNHKKGKLEKNCKYKKMFRYQDIKGCKYRDAKEQLKAALDGLDTPVVKNASELQLKDLAKRFLKEGMEGPRLKLPELNYKESTIKRYSAYITALLLLKHKDKEKIKDLTKKIIYKNKISNKPIGDYLCSEISLWHVEVLRERLKDTPPTADAAVQMVSILFKWAIINNIFEGENPCRNFAWREATPFKAKLLDEDTAKLKNHIKGKAFDYQPHFLACVGLHLYTGQRAFDVFGLRWEAPLSEEEKKACTGWLLEGWENIEKPKIYLWTTKNHKSFKVHIDQDTLKILKRLREANLRDRNSWALKSPYIFPQKKNPLKCVTYSSYQKLLLKLNIALGFERLEGDNISRVSGKRKIFSFKIARKTFATEIARNKGGVSLASRKLGHSSLAPTIKNYIVPDDTEMEIENLYENNLPEKDVAVVVKSPWNKKPLADKD